MMCSQYEMGQCENQTCPKRHSNFHLEKNRKAIPCYWEMHGGCSKPFCPFKHCVSSGKNNVTLTEISKTAKENVIPKSKVHAMETSPIGGNSSMKKLNNVLCVEQRHEMSRLNGPTTLSDDGGVKGLEKTGKGTFQPSIINFNVKSLDEIQKVKELKKTSNSSTVTNIEKPKKWLFNCTCDS